MVKQRQWKRAGECASQTLKCRRNGISPWINGKFQFETEGEVEIGGTGQSSLQKIKQLSHVLVQAVHLNLHLDRPQETGGGGGNFSPASKNSPE
jgi:hypothetical protein